MSKEKAETTQTPAKASFATPKEDEEEEGKSVSYINSSSEKNELFPRFEPQTLGARSNRIKKFNFVYVQAGSGRAGEKNLCMNFSEPKKTARCTFFCCCWLLSMFGTALALESFEINFASERRSPHGHNNFCGDGGVLCTKFVAMAIQQQNCIECSPIKCQISVIIIDRFVSSSHLTASAQDQHKARWISMIGHCL